MNDFDNWLANANEHARQAGLENAINDTIKTVTDRERKAVEAARRYLRDKAYASVEEVVGLTICKGYRDWENLVLVFDEGHYLCLESDRETGMTVSPLDTFDANELDLLPKHFQTEIQEATADKNEKLRKLKAQQTLKCAVATLGLDEVRKAINDV